MEGEPEANCAPRSTHQIYKAAILDARIRKPSELGRESGVVNEGIDRAKVGMIENILHAHVEREGRPLFNFKILEQSEIADVGPVIAERIPAGIAKRCSENGIRLCRVGNETNLLVCDYHRLISRDARGCIQSVQTNERSRGHRADWLSSCNAKEIAGVSRVNPNRSYWGRGIAQERAKRAV